MPWPLALCFATYSAECGGIPSRACGVGHVAAVNAIKAFVAICCPLPIRRRTVSGFSECFRTSLAIGVGHGDPILPLADMGGVHGASRDINRPAGVTFSLQISGDSVEPIIASRSRNLLSHKDSGPSGTGEAKDVGPQMPWIVSTGAFPRDREGLAGARGCPNRSSIGPSGKPGGKAPSADAGEQVDLCKSVEVAGLKLDDAALVDDAGRDVALVDEPTQPVSGDGIVFVVEGLSTQPRLR